MGRIKGLAIAPALAQPMIIRLAARAEVALRRELRLESKLRRGARVRVEEHGYRVELRRGKKNWRVLLVARAYTCSGTPNAGAVLVLTRSQRVLGMARIVRHAGFRLVATD